MLRFWLGSKCKGLIQITICCTLVGCGYIGKKAENFQKSESSLESDLADDGSETKKSRARNDLLEGDDHDDQQDLIIDHILLNRELGLERLREKIGYQEKIFDTCQVGAGYPSNLNCRQKYLVSLYIRVVCRQSEGTISTPLGESDFFPLSGRTLNWSLGKKLGEIQLDEQGYGQILTVARQSQKRQRLKLTSADQFLFMRAQEMSRLVTPKSWCN